MKAVPHWANPARYAQCDDESSCHRTEMHKSTSVIVQLKLIRTHTLCNVVDGGRLLTTLRGRRNTSSTKLIVVIVVSVDMVADDADESTDARQ